MSHKDEDVDINKAFENILFAEEQIKESAYTEGYDIGEKQLLEGYHLGYHKASLLAGRLGYYGGILENYLYNNQNSSDKIVTLAKQILEDIHNFPKRNNHTIDVAKAIEDIKFKYAKFCSLAKLHHLYPEVDKLEF